MHAMQALAACEGVCVCVWGDRPSGKRVKLLAWQEVSEMGGVPTTEPWRGRSPGAALGDTPCACSYACVSASLCLCVSVCVYTLLSDSQH